MRKEPVQYWVITKGAFRTVLFNAHLPMEVRGAVLDVYKNNGYTIAEGTKYN